MENNTYGYVRVSTQEQNEARQLAAMREFGVEQASCFIVCMENMGAKLVNGYSIYSSTVDISAELLPPVND